MQRHLQLSELRAKTTAEFQRFDKDGKGTIRVKDLRAGFRSLGLDSSETRIQDEIHEVAVIDWPAFVIVATGGEGQSFQEGIANDDQLAKSSQAVY